MDLLNGRSQNRGVGLRLLGVSLLEIRQQPETQVFPLRAAGKAQLLQALRRFPGAFLVREQRGDDAERPPLGGNPLRKIQPRQTPGREHAQQKRVENALAELRNGQQKQQRGRPAVQRQAEEKTQP